MNALQRVMQDLTLYVLPLQEECNCQIWIEYSPHVNWIDYRVCAGKWYENSEMIKGTLHLNTEAGSWDVSAFVKMLKEKIAALHTTAWDKLLRERQDLINEKLIREKKGETYVGC